MRFNIDIEETIRRINTYTVEVLSDEEGNRLLEKIESGIRNAVHPDDVSLVIQDAGYKVQEITEGVEECEYELY